MIEHLRGRDRKLELHGWTGREAEWDRSGLPSQRRLHAGAILSLLRYAPGPGVSFREDVACSQTGRRDRVADLEQRRENVPHIEQGDLPGARS